MAIISHTQAKREQDGKAKHKRGKERDWCSDFSVLEISMGWMHCRIIFCMESVFVSSWFRGLRFVDAIIMMREDEGGYTQVPAAFWWSYWLGGIALGSVVVVSCC